MVTLIFLRGLCVYGHHIRTQQSPRAVSLVITEGYFDLSKGGCVDKQMHGLILEAFTLKKTPKIIEVYIVTKSPRNYSTYLCYMKNLHKLVHEELVITVVHTKVLLQLFKVFLAGRVWISAFGESC